MKLGNSNFEQLPNPNSEMKNPNSEASMQTIYTNFKNPKWKNTCKCKRIKIDEIGQF